MRSFLLSVRVAGGWRLRKRAEANYPRGQSHSWTALQDLTMGFFVFAPTNIEI